MHNPTSLNNKEKIVTLFDKLDENGIEGIEKKILKTIIYLIGKEITNSFVYNFNVRSSPYSDEFEDDLDGLLRAELLEGNYIIKITGLGKKCHESFGDRADEFFDTINPRVTDLISMNIDSLRELLYLESKK